MKQNYPLLLFSFFCMIWSGYGQNWTEDFNNNTNGYGTGTININGRTWSRSDAGNFGYGNTVMGNRAFTINDDKSNAHITTPLLNTCGTVTFDYAYVNGNSSNVFQLQVSTDGTNFTTIDTKTLGPASDEMYVSYSYDINNSSATTYVRILSNNQNAHLFIDNFTVTSFTPTGPTITAAPTTLTGLDYFYNMPPSSEDTFTIEGTDLTNDIVITAPTDFEISLTSGTGFTNSITLTESSGTVASTTIYARLISGKAVGTYTDDVDITSTGASTKTVSLTGDVVDIYCNAGPTSSADSEIENVTLTGVSLNINNNTTGDCTGAAGGVINDYTAQSADVYPGGSYALSVEFGDCDNGGQYDGAGGVWIDWNNDGDFDDTDEEISTVEVAVSGGNVIENITINVPAAQALGNYRMRIVQDEGGTASTISPCGTFNWGSVEDYTITVTAATGNLITVTQATGGTISPGSTIVADNANQSFTATPDACYTFTNWIVDGVNAGNTNPYTFTNVTTDHTITAVYTQDSYTITATAGANGSISPSGNTTVNCGEDQTYNITANSGYTVADVLVDGVSLGAVSSYDFTNVTEAHTISVTFEVYIAPQIVITEFAGKGYNGNFNDEYIEIANFSATSVDLVGWTLEYYEGSLEKTINLTGVLAPYTAYVIAARNSHTAAISPDIVSSFSMNNVAYAILKEGTIIRDEAGSSSNKFNDDYNYEFIDCPNDNKPVANWDNLNTGNGTPGVINCNTPEPEIEIQGNGIEIVNGATSPNTADDTDFGNVAVAGGTNPNTFTIHNTGTADLDITSITSSNATEFAISGATLGLITPGNSASFTVTFDPNATGTRTATITVNSDDANESVYTFGVTGNGTNSNASDIIANASFTYNSNIDYTAYQNATINNTSQSIDVFKFDIRDGGGTNDTDALATELTDITFNVVNNDNIRSAALFNGNALVSNTGVVSGNTISFSGLSYAAPDNGTASLSLRVTFQQTVTDNDQLEFTISAATANTSGSVFGSTDAGGITSSTINNRNRIEVTADRIAFTIQPTSTSVNTNLNTFHISAVDQFDNIDLDDTLNIVLSTSGVGMTSSSPYSLTNGDLAISNVQFNTSQTNINLTATTTGLAFSNTTTSTNFDILDVAVGTYRTTGNGTWPSGTATWERLTTSGWVTATPATNTTNLLIIRHTVTSRASFAAGDPYTSMIVENGASFDDEHNSTFGSLLVKDGGTFIASNPAVDIHPTGTLTVENGGTFVINSSSLNHDDGLFDGTENFEPNSTVEVRQFDNDSSNGEDDLIDSDSAISTNSDGYYFGNLFINFTPSSSNDGKALTLVGITGTQKLCNNLTVVNNTVLKSVLLTNVNANIEIGGNVEVIQNKFAFGAVGSSDLTHTVKGNIIANGGIIDINQTLNTSSGAVVVNLEGDLIGTNGTIQSTDSNCGIAFTGSSLQNIDVTNAVPYNKINTYIKNNAEVQLLNNNLKLNNSSTFTVENGGSFNFNWAADGTTPLLITNGGSGTNTFNSEEGSILKITHLDGLVKNTANAGNVQLSVSNKTFNQTATFHYIGKDNQVTGDGLTTGSTGKLVYVNLLDNAKELSLTNNIGISDGTTLDPNGGKLEIQKGIVLGTNSGDFTGSGRLVMTDGEYRISTITTTPLSNYLPQLSSYADYELTGGSVNLNGDDDIQILSGAPNYYNLTFSGTNTLNSNYKSISGATSVSNAILISENAIVNVENNSLGATGGPSFTMLDNSRYITDGGGTKPDTSGDYTLAPNTTIEFANTSGAGVIRIGSPKIDYAHIEVSGTNVSNASPTTGIHFQSGGTFIVKSNATFKLNNTDGFNGSSSTAIDIDNTPNITLEETSTIEYKGDSQSITHFSPNYKTLVVSGTGTKTLDHDTDILVNENLHINSSSLLIETDKALTVNKSVNIDNLANFHIENNGALIQIDDTSVNTGSMSMERKASIKNYDYVYWSSPISGFNISDIAGSYYFYWHPTTINSNGTQGNWIAANNTTMDLGKGYIIRAPNGQTAPATPGELNFTTTFSSSTPGEGVPNNGEIAVTIERGINANSDEDKNDNWNLIGNPYPSAISASDFIIENAAQLQNIDGYINIWTHGTPPSTAEPSPFYQNFANNYNSADYFYYNALGDSNGDGFSGYIAAGQSFMVNMVDGSEAATTTVTFNNSMRDKGYSNSDFFRASPNSSNEKHRFWLNLLTPTTPTNRILVGYTEAATMGEDLLFDAETVLGETSAGVYSMIDDDYFLIQGRALPFAVTDIIPLSVKTIESGSHTLALHAVDGIFETDNQTIYLKDNVLGFTHDLTAQPYTFTLEPGTYNDRFEIVFIPSTLSIDDHQSLSNTITITELTEDLVQFNVDGPHSIKHIAIIDINGRLVYSLEGHNSTEVYNLSKLSQAAYMAKITLSNGQVLSKKALKQY